MTSGTRRRSGRDADWTDTEAEGLPATEDQPPGYDAETAIEGIVPPADHPGVSADVGVTEAEEAAGETVAERAARERPDVPPEPPRDHAGRLVVGATDTDDDPGAGEWAEDGGGLSAEEDAVHIEEG